MESIIYNQERIAQIVQEIFEVKRQQQEKKLVKLYEIVELVRQQQRGEKQFRLLQVLLEKIRIQREILGQYPTIHVLRKQLQEPVFLAAIEELLIKQQCFEQEQLVEPLPIRRRLIEQTIEEELLEVLKQQLKLKTIVEEEYIQKPWNTIFEKYEQLPYNTIVEKLFEKKPYNFLPYNVEEKIIKQQLPYNTLVEKIVKEQLPYNTLVEKIVEQKPWGTLVEKIVQKPYKTIVEKVEQKPWTTIVEKEEIEQPMWNTMVVPQQRRLIEKLFETIMVKEEMLPVMPVLKELIKCVMYPIYNKHYRPEIVEKLVEKIGEEKLVEKIVEPRQFYYNTLFNKTFPVEPRFVEKKTIVEEPCFGLTQPRFVEKKTIVEEPCFGLTQPRFVEKKTIVEPCYQHQYHHLQHQLKREQEEILAIEMLEQEQKLRRHHEEKRIQKELVREMLVRPTLFEEKKLIEKEQLVRPTHYFPQQPYWF